MDMLLRTRFSPELMLLLIIVLLPFLGWIAVKEIRFLLRIRSCTELIPGKITSLSEVSRGRHGSRFSPYIQYTYTGRDGEEHTDFYETEHSYSYDEYAVGMSVHLFIDPADSSNVYLAAEKQDARKTLLLMPVIAVFLIAAGYIGAAIRS